MSEKKKKDVPQEQPQPEKKAAEAAAAEETADVPEVEEVFTVTREQMEQFESLAKLVSDGNDKYLRLAAEYDNYRKRTAKEKESIYPDAKQDTVKPFPDVADNLDPADSQFAVDPAERRGGSFLPVDDEALPMPRLILPPGLGLRLPENADRGQLLSVLWEMGALRPGQVAVQLKSAQEATKTA